MSWDEDRDIDWRQLNWHPYGEKCHVVQYAQRTCRGDEDGNGERFDSSVIRYRVVRDGFKDINLFIDKHKKNLIIDQPTFRCDATGILYYTTYGVNDRSHVGLMMKHAVPGDICVAVHITANAGTVYDSVSATLVEINTMKPTTVLSMDNDAGTIVMLVDVSGSPRIVTHHSKC